MAHPVSRVDSAVSTALNFREYYSEGCVSCGHEHANFHDIDEIEELNHGIQNITSLRNRNLFLDFSDSNAWAGFDLSASTIMDLVEKGGWPGETSTRWIDISFPIKQKALIEKLAYHYDFSPRLLAMMCSEPEPERDQSSSQSQVTLPARSARRFWRLNRPGDVEKDVVDTSDLKSVSSNNPVRSGNLYKLIADVWHYSSVDQGSNYLCLGYNSIYYTGDLHPTTEELPGHTKTPLPDCVRVWTWLILCGDRTIITINEDIFHESYGQLTSAQKAILLKTKQNHVNVFRSLSKADDPMNPSLNRLPIRKRLAEGHKSAHERARDAPGLLFYFHFENWFNSYSLVTRRDSRYSKALQDIRSEMFHKPQLTHIDRLDQVGNELNLLKRHYKSYIRIIDRITELSSGTESNTLSSSQVTARMIEDDEGHLIMPAVQTGGTALIGVDPGPAAYVRFERLKDMITLYALSEVKDYLDKKQTLVDMNFQLIAIHESRDVERLTRVSLLITKATILFLPVSLMTAYFGSNISNENYTVAQYWIAFIVVLVLSYVVLIAFGVISGTMDNYALPPPIRRYLTKVLKRKDP